MSDDPSEPPSSTPVAFARAAGPRGLAGVALVALVVAWFVRPWLHDVVYLVYATPAAWVAALLALFGFVLLRIQVDAFTAARTAAVVFVVLAGVGGAAAGFLSGSTLGHQTMTSAQTVDHVDASDPSHPRILTKSVAEQFASNTLNFPQYTISDGDIAVENGTPYWSFALEPDGTWNYLTKRQHGTVFVDMTTENARVNTVTGDMNAGIGAAFYNNYRWHLLKHGPYLASYGDPYMITHDGEQYVVAPYTKPQFHWLPIPYTTPKWGGDVVIAANGTQQTLTPKQAASSPVLSGQKLYPFDLTRQKVAATKYRNGILNTYTSHKGQIEIAPVPGDGNDQPFFVLTKRGPEYVVAVEPYGNAQGLKEIWLVDARTGAYHRYVPNESLFGPRKATTYVRKAARTTDWDRFTPAEPIPAVVNGRLYWEVRVVSNDGSGISYVAFVDARNSDVHDIQSSKAVSKFLRGENVSGRGGGGQNTSARHPSLVVQRVAPNGSVIQTMNVYGNESIRVVNGDAANGTKASAGNGTAANASV